MENYQNSRTQILFFQTVSLLFQDLLLLCGILLVFLLHQKKRKILHFFDVRFSLCKNILKNTEIKNNF